MIPVLPTPSDLSAWIDRLFEMEEMAQMGHAQRTTDRNLGLGFLYYGLARVVRRRTAVVIGSYRGFVPLVLARALSDNVEGGEVVFIDPSMVDDFWRDASAVADHFRSFGQTNIRHSPMTTQEFASSTAFANLEDVGIVFVDGYHTAEQSEFDFQTLLPKLAPGGFFLFHDSTRRRISRIYGPDKAYEHTVKLFMDQLKQDAEFQVMDFPFDDGLTVVRRLEGE